MYDLIVIGAGSGGLSTGLFMAKAGFKVLMIARTAHEIGGDCLNDGCVPSKAFIHVAKVVHSARQAAAFGLQVSGKADMSKAIAYVHSRQDIIRKRENAQWLREQGIEMALGTARFSGRKEVMVGQQTYQAMKIVIATGSRPRKLRVEGVEKVKYHDNESIFQLEALPERMLVVGGGPIGIEMAQAMARLGSQVTVVHRGSMILEKEEPTVAEILLKRLKQEGIQFFLHAEVDQFTSANDALLKQTDGRTSQVSFDAVFVAIGRELNLEPLQLGQAGIKVADGKIVTDSFLRTTNKDVIVCGDVAGNLLFSHAAEFHARILLNNFFSPLKKKLDNRHFSWVTFTDPELATFGLSEKQLKEQSIGYVKLEHDFAEDDRAVVDHYPYGKLILYLSKGSLLRKQNILGGTMVAPNAGELVQELILANTSQLSIEALFNKIYPYPVAARVNQSAIVKHKENALTGAVKKLLHIAYRV